MRIPLLIIFICLINNKIYAQSKAKDIIESGKTLIELIRIIKSPKLKGNELTTSQNSTEKNTINQIDDSCLAKQRSNLCYLNRSSKSILISIYKRMATAEGYEPNPFTMKVLTQKQECWYQLKTGIYKYRIETDTGGIRTLLAEGELKLEACENMIREVSE